MAVRYDRSDGKRYPNRMQFRRIERPHLIEIDHGADKDKRSWHIPHQPSRSMSRATARPDITLRQLHPTKLSGAGIGFGAVEFGIRPWRNWRSTSNAVNAS